MGCPKALLSVSEHETFVSRLVRVLRDGGVDDVVVVAPADGPIDAIRTVLTTVPPDARVVVNPDPSRGQLSSLLVGLGSIDRPGVSAMLMTLVDVPLVTADSVRTIMEAYASTRAPIVRPARLHDGVHGHPVIFDRALFSELRQASFDTGAKHVVRAHQNEIVNVPIDDDGAFIDIDTPADYARALGRSLPDTDGVALISRLHGLRMR